MQQPPEADPDDLPRLTLGGIMAAVAVFAVMVAIGVYRKTGKLLAIPVVLGTVGLFLLVWFLAWRRRAAAGARKNGDQA